MKTINKKIIKKELMEEVIFEVKEWYLGLDEKDFMKYEEYFDMLINKLEEI